MGTGPQKIVTIITHDQIEEHGRYADWSLNQNHPSTWEPDLTQIADLNPEHPRLNLIIAGGHGLCDTTTGEPIQLNNQGLGAIRQQIAMFESKGIKFHTITMTSCFSAAFIPEFQRLLTKDGVIFCQTLSSTSGIETLLPMAKEKEGDVFSAYFASLELKITCSEKLAMTMGHKNSPFISDSVYTHRNRVLYRFSNPHLEASLAGHNDLISGMGVPDTAEELERVIQKLSEKGIRVRDIHLTTNDIELTTRALVLRYAPRVEKMLDSEIPHLLVLDHIIFSAEERPFTEQDLRDYYDADYSFVACLEKPSEEIAGYLFAKQQDDGTIFIGNIGVVPQYQALGIGTQLLRHLLHQIDSEATPRKIRLQVSNQNSNAIRMYEKLGFKNASSSDEWTQMERLAQSPPSASPTVDAPITGRPRSSSEPNKEIQELLRKTPSPQSNVSNHFLLQTIASLTATAALLGLAYLLLPSAGMFDFNTTAQFATAATSLVASASIFTFWAVKALEPMPQPRAFGAGYEGII